MIVSALSFPFFICHCVLTVREYTCHYEETTAPLFLVVEQRTREKDTAVVLQRNDDLQVCLCDSVNRMLQLSLEQEFILKYDDVHVLFTLSFICATSWDLS